VVRSLAEGGLINEEVTVSDGRQLLFEFDWVQLEIVGAVFLPLRCVHLFNLDVDKIFDVTSSAQLDVIHLGNMLVLANQRVFVCMKHLFKLKF
jgi:hypothetical protein